MFNKNSAININSPHRAAGLIFPVKAIGRNTPFFVQNQRTSKIRHFLDFKKTNSSTLARPFEIRYQIPFPCPVRWTRIFDDKKTPCRRWISVPRWIVAIRGRSFLRVWRFCRVKKTHIIDGTVRFWLATELELFVKKSSSSVARWALTFAFALRSDIKRNWLLSSIKKPPCLVPIWKRNRCCTAMCSPCPRWTRVFHKFVDDVGCWCQTLWAFFWSDF